jgi:hypothetical protein
MSRDRVYEIVLVAVLCPQAVTRSRDTAERPTRDLRAAPPFLQRTTRSQIETGENEFDEVLD